MVAATVLVVVAVGALLVPELRAEPATWAFAAVLIALAVVRFLGVAGSSAIQTARQVRYLAWWGYTSHDSSGERDISEKRGD
jgi:uncharacterized membrane protein YfcA